MGWILIFLVVRLGAPKSDRLAFLRSTYSFVLFPLEEPHAPRLGLVLHADLVVGTGLPAVLEQTGDLVSELGHPLVMAFSSRRPTNGSGSQGVGKVGFRGLVGSVV